MPGKTSIILRAVPLVAALLFRPLPSQIVIPISPARVLGFTSNEHLNPADVILLLISPDFLASDYCYSIEMQRAMKRHETRKARIIPIILRHVDWERAPFARLLALPSGSKPVTEWPMLDQAFLDVAEGIKQVVSELQTLSQARSFMATGNCDEALKVYDEILKSNSRSASAHAGRGHVLSRLQQYPEAANAYEQALLHDSTMADIYVGKANALRHINQYKGTLHRLCVCLHKRQHAHGRSLFQVLLTFSPVRVALPTTFLTA